MSGAIQVNTEKANAEITKIVNKLIRLNNDLENEKVSAIFEDELHYHFGRLDGICSILGVNVDKIIDKAGLHFFKRITELVRNDELGKTFPNRN